LIKVLLLGSASQTIIGRPIVPDAAVHAVVEEHVSIDIPFQYANQVFYDGSRNIIRLDGMNWSFSRYLHQQCIQRLSINTYAFIMIIRIANCVWLYNIISHV